MSREREGDEQSGIITINDRMADALLRRANGEITEEEFWVEYLAGQEDALRDA